MLFVSFKMIMEYRRDELKEEKYLRNKYANTTD